MIIQELNEIQKRCGFLPTPELQALSQRLRVPLHRIHEVASFYPLFRLQPPRAVEVRVCRDMSCHLRGAASLRARLQDYANKLGPDQIDVGGVSCLGQCDHAPAITINEQGFGGLSEDALRGLIQSALRRQSLPTQPADRGPPNWKIDVYEGRPRYEAVRRLVQSGDADGLLKALERANLRGMGGAGFPTARKWSAVRAAAGDVKYVICNADESEPGTFKDRELLRRTPYLTLEGMILAGLVSGAQKGILYIRHEYHEEAEAFAEALRHAVAEHLCGENILDSGRSFPVEIFVSPGGYIQGEESALLEALEDRRGEPRNKPPFPVTHGLFGKPTIINNVETLAWVPAIALRGGEWYRDEGVRGATGLRLVSISGDVNQPGVYEVPFGQAVRELVFDTAGGVTDGQRLKAIATSGPSGGFLPAKIPAALLPEKFAQANLSAGASEFDILDLRLDLATLGALGGMLGAAFVVYGDRRDMVEQALNCVAFFRNESCGKCVPCRMGSEKLVDVLTELTQGRLPRTELPLVPELAETMTLTSICGLGQVAANPITSVLKYFPDEVERYLRQASGERP